MYTRLPKPNSSLKTILKTEWTLSPEIKDNDLLRHFILYWEPQYFKQMLNKSDIPGTLYKDGVTYNVIGYRCTLEDLMATTNQVVLSFRQPIAAHNIYPIVLVSCAKSASATAKSRETLHKRKSGKHCEASHIKVRKPHAA